MRERAILVFVLTIFLMWNNKYSNDNPYLWLFNLYMFNWSVVVLFTT